MPKVRVLYPTALQQTKWSDAVAGQIVEMTAEEAEAHAAAGHVEPEKVERATKAPGEKRHTRVPEA